MARALNPTELAWARHLIGRGACLEQTPCVTQRRAWLDFLGRPPLAEPCSCGQCPSVGILDEDGRAASGPASFVLHGGTRDMLILMHIVDDRPAYLEAAVAAPVDRLPPAPGTP